MRYLPVARALTRYAAPAPTATTQPYALQQQFAAKKQVAWALAGYPDLTHVSAAEDLQVFSLPPVDDGGAYRHATYWVALASRILDNRRLGATAGYYANWSTFYPVSSLSSGSASKIMFEAAAAVQQAINDARVNRFDPVRINEAQSIANKLLEYGQPTSIVGAQDNDEGFLADMRRLMALSETLGKLATAATLGLGGVAAFVIVWGVLKIAKKVRR